MMSEKLIFLSHITEEKELAKIIKDAIEDEFAGFVRVFVSSDGETIRAGQNVLKVIEDGLVECCAAIYLISPASVLRSWISFELGAVWIRNAQNQREGREEIPALPFCHSGMSFGALPQPISNLNAIEANIASKLEFAFKSLQLAVGAKGRFRTDFNELASKINKFERSYTLLNKVEEVLRLTGLQGQARVDFVHYVTKCQTPYVSFTARTVEANSNRIFGIIENDLSDLASYSVIFAGMEAGPRGSFNVCEYEVKMNTSILKETLKI
ncbi:toll/interleukin-1 receptor domain-containing protein [Franconibacter daqui]|uniref:toll/interleukin-1 receptor domain-containing protein n=1 Tax=Franconibacter daqui TaxID=2047724 RepID=UPI002DB67225|nr:toll/interleukin-1 receptor domain-containing protein [Franconibacter daqui]MEB5922257.1 toll/interleukin-1 receptor domain-containing protein [Franconibacter daqui]